MCRHCQSRARWQVATFSFRPSSFPLVSSPSLWVGALLFHFSACFHSSPQLAALPCPDPSNSSSPALRLQTGPRYCLLAYIRNTLTCFGSQLSTPLNSIVFVAYSFHAANPSASVLPPPRLSPIRFLPCAGAAAHDDAHHGPKLLLRPPGLPATHG